MRTVESFLSAAILLTMSAIAFAENGRFLYIQTNDIREGRNAVLGYERLGDGSLKPLAENPFFTAGTGMNNDTHGKLGPNDNDTPVVISTDGKFLYAVNVHSNTIAAFNIANDGTLSHVSGSPFASHGIAPNSLSIAGKILLVSNRNGDYHQRKALQGAVSANYVSLQIKDDGSLEFASKIEVKDNQKPTQIHASATNSRVAFGNDFQVDVDFDGEGDRSFLAGNDASVEGQLHVFLIGNGGQLTEAQKLTLPETNEGYKYKGTPGVPSMPLGIWSHPKKDLLYVGFVTRNELGTFRVGREGKLEFLGSVPNSGQDICWVLPNQAGTRLYTVNNLPRPDLKQKAGTVSTYDISGENAEKPVEIGFLELPHPGNSFVNNRNFEQPGSTPFQCAIDPESKFFYVICQRIDQTSDNNSIEGNHLHTLKLDDNGMPTVAHSRPLGPDGVDFRSRPQGIVTINTPTNNTAAQK